jgi:hypothetical protein
MARAFAAAALLAGCAGGAPESAGPAAGADPAAAA